MTTNILQAPFQLFRRDSDCTGGFDASSPPSSPCSLYDVDSSPPSTPPTNAYELDRSDEGDDIDIISMGVRSPDASSPTIVRRTDGKGKGKEKSPANQLNASPEHPYSASTRANKRPPSYSKDATRPKVKRRKNNFDPESDLWHEDDVFGTPGPGRGATRLHECDSYIQSAVPSIEVNAVADCEVTRSHDPEDVLWEEILAQAVDAAECKIDLSGQGLTYIPPNIADLSKLVVIPGTVSPIHELAPRRTCSKSTNSIVFGAGKLGQRQDEIHLFLARNMLTMLPNELFNLDALVVLSLRGNRLTEIPPLICQLRNLRELNVSNNQLRYLPSEIMTLKLNELALDPNPFEKNPHDKANPSNDRWFGQIERKHIIVPLTELPLRALLAPSAANDLHETTSISGSHQQQTILEYWYDLPLRSDCLISPALRETLSSCVPGSIASSQATNAAPYASPEARRPDVSAGTRPCVSICPSPRHLDVSESNYRRPVFVTHAEERLAWEKYVAGQRVGGESGIPIRWRGCSAGCLDDLEQSGAACSNSVENAKEDDWTVSMDVDVGDPKSTPAGGNTLKEVARVDETSLPTYQLKEDFKTFDSADIDLDV